MRRMGKLTARTAVALAMLALLSCHGRVPRPGKPIAPGKQSQVPQAWHGHAATTNATESQAGLGFLQQAGWTRSQPESGHAV